MIRTLVTPRAVAILTAAMVLVACGSTPAAPDETASPTPDHSAMEGMDHSPSPSAPASESAAESPSAEPTDDGGTGAVEVVVGGSSFSPGLLTVSPGTEVTFVNSSGLPHTVTHGTSGRAADDPAFDRPVSDGSSVTITFDEPGTFDITCKLHPTMQMTVVVEG